MSNFGHKSKGHRLRCGEVNMAAVSESTNLQSTGEDDQKLPIIDIARFSSLRNLNNTMSWVLNSLTKLSRKVHEHNAAREEALNCIVGQVQKESFSDTIQA